MSKKEKINVELLEVQASPSRLFAFGDDMLIKVKIGNYIDKLSMNSQKNISVLDYVKSVYNPVNFNYSKFNIKYTAGESQELYIDV